MAKVEKKATRAERVSRASRERRAAHRDELRRRILDTAASLVLAEGYEAFSLRRLAERIGYSATTIYRHYRDKADLLLAVVDRGFEIFGRELESAASRATDPVARVREIGGAYVRFGLENPVYYQLMFMRPKEQNLEVPESSARLRIATFTTLKRAVDAAVDAGRLRPGDTLAYSNALWAVVHGAVALALVTTPPEPVDVEATALLAIDAMLDGLRGG